MKRGVHFDLTDALTKGPPPAGSLTVPIFSHGSLVLEFYTPHALDMQTPHGRDELYFVARGEALFFDGKQRYSVEPGACVFVPAGERHRFESISHDFAAWVVFYGPKGGEPDA